MAEESFYKILVSGVDGEEVLREMVNEMLRRKLSEKITFDFLHKAAETERCLNLGDKAIFHLIAFVAYCFALVQSDQ